MAIKQQLRPYQVDIGQAILRSVLDHTGLTFTVEVARQGGKNELSAQLELLLLTLFLGQSGNLVKAAPTYIPQLLHSIRRLKERLTDAGYQGLWSTEAGNVIQIGKARQLFLSAEPSARVVGATAHVLLEIDEAQEVDREKYYKEFRPMAASTNATAVLYGTPWDGTSLLDETRDQNLELERQDGIKRHFHYDWQEVARYNPLYQTFVEGERQRLGEEHPLFRSQYLLQPVHGGRGLLSAGQRAQLQGQHQRQHAPTPGAVYIAGLDLAGGTHDGAGIHATGESSARDSTVLTIGELDFQAGDPLTGEPQVRVVEHRCWTGVSPASLYPTLLDLLRQVWGCRRVTIDATGLGQGPASFLERTLGGSIVEPFTFTAQSKSRLGFDLLAAVNTGRLKMYAADSSQEYREFWGQIERSEAYFRPDRTMNFLVDPKRGHDDFVSSLALLVRASRYAPRVARGRTRGLAQDFEAAVGAGR